MPTATIERRDCARAGFTPSSVAADRPTRAHRRVPLAPVTNGDEWRQRPSPVRSQSASATRLVHANATDGRTGPADRNEHDPSLDSFTPTPPPTDTLAGFATTATQPDSITPTPPNGRTTPARSQNVTQPDSFTPTPPNGRTRQVGSQERDPARLVTTDPPSQNRAGRIARNLTRTEVHNRPTIGHPGPVRNNRTQPDLFTADPPSQNRAGRIARNLTRTEVHNRPTIGHPGPVSQQPHATRLVHHRPTIAEPGRPDRRKPDAN